MKKKEQEKKRETERDREIKCVQLYTECVPLQVGDRFIKIRKKHIVVDVHCALFGED
jgi:hypothetical protein